MMRTRKNFTANQQTVLPEVLVDYLLHLAFENGTEHQTFLLSISQAGVGEVQEILQLCGAHTYARRVFGYQPLHGRVDITMNDGAPLISYQEEALPCSA